MPVSVEVLFGRPQREIAALLTARLAQAVKASVVTGFATVEGVEAILPAFRANPGKLETLVLGAGTYRAFEAIDRLIAAGVPADRLFVHLGHTRATGSGAKYTFYRYHPMLHSKIYFMEAADGTAYAFIGSHNLTGFALNGMNGEASVLMTGPASSPEFNPIKDHIAESRAQSMLYSPAMKEALTWWTTQFVDGLRLKINDEDREDELKRTIVVLAVKADEPLPDEGDIIYFEIPAALGTIQSLRAEVHIYVFSTKPASVHSALASLGTAQKALWCRVEGLEKDQGGAELRADWYIDRTGDPKLVRAPKPFRPRTARDMQQVRVSVRNPLFGEYEYLFEPRKTRWKPVFDEDSRLEVSPDEAERLRALKLIPPEDKEWLLVRHLKPAEKPPEDKYEIALRQYSPEGGGFILFSMRRRKLA
jgi:hypothetical protein